MKKFIFGLILFYLGYQTVLGYMDIDTRLTFGIIIIIVGLFFILIEIYPNFIKWLINEFRD